MQNQLIDEVIKKLQNLQGVDLIYFLDANCQLIKEERKSNVPDYLEQIKNILKLGPVVDNISKTFHSKSFCTVTLLNESGLIVISRLNLPESLYVVIVAGENKPIDLITLLKICKEVQSNSILLTSD